MTLFELVSSGIARIRKPYWADPETYLKLDLLPGGRGPWGHLYSRPTQELIGSGTPQDVPALDDTDEDWEAYEGPLDADDSPS